jgi:hypothetical protein
MMAGWSLTNKQKRGVYVRTNVISYTDWWQELPDIGRLSLISFFDVTLMT